MSVQLSYDFIKKVVPTANSVLLKGFVDTFNKNAEKYGINSPRRLAAFLSQVAHESDGLKTAREYASGAAYEGRKDLGNTQKGDGVNFRGRGFIQTTGRANYKDTSQALFGDDRLLTTPMLLEVPETATNSAMYFWSKKGLNDIADKPDNWTIKVKIKGKIVELNKFQYLTYRINGGLNGYKARETYWEKAKKLLSSTITPTATNTAKGIITICLFGIVLYICQR